MHLMASQVGDGASSFRRYWSDVKTDVDLALGDFLDARAVPAARIGPDAEQIVRAIRSLTMRGGKRFRPVLLAAAYEGHQGAGGRRAVTMAGVALELLQTYFLIHDDWMDDDDVRRGGPSVHAMLREAFGSRHVGDATAIIAGDYAASLANEALLETPVPATHVVSAIRLMAEIQEDVCFGQVLDIRGKATDVEKMHELKTASYTVCGPMAMGAALAGASRAAIERLRAFGRPLGIAFQVRDDILGTFGSPETTGKPAGNDLRQGKRTALIAELEGDAGARPLLERCFGKVDASAADVVALADYMIESGAKARVEARLDALIAEASRALGSLDITDHAKRILAGATGALVHREH